jgi:hypothetical protein
MKRKKMIYLLPALLLLWIMADINWPYKTDLKKINPPEIARLDGAMWRAYYLQQPVKMFLQTAELMRGQYHVPFWRSNVMAYYAARAAFIFKKGRDTGDYDKALPPLIKYFEAINKISNVPFDVNEAARLELRWWVIRRYRQQHPPAEWEDCLAKAAEAIYHVDAAKFAVYARWRTEAMLLRDEKDTNITEADWQQIDAMLHKAWDSFGNALK